MTHHPIPWCDGIAQPFGADPATYGRGGMQGHNGIDFAAPDGTPVHAALAGRVVHAGPGDVGPWAFLLGNSAGTAVLIEHEGMVTGYAHLSDLACTVGDAVEEGELIALSGRSGYVGGPHLHFEVLPMGEGRALAVANGYLGRIDPLPLIVGAES